MGRVCTCLCNICEDVWSTTDVGWTQIWQFLQKQWILKRSNINAVSHLIVPRVVRSSFKDPVAFPLELSISSPNCLTTLCEPLTPILLTPSLLKCFYLAESRAALIKWSYLLLLFTRQPSDRLLKGLFRSLKSTGTLLSCFMPFTHFQPAYPLKNVLWHKQINPDPVKNIYWSNFHSLKASYSTWP